MVDYASMFRVTWLSAGRELGPRGSQMFRCELPGELEKRRSPDPFQWCRTRSRHLAKGGRCPPVLWPRQRPLPIETLRSVILCPPQQHYPTGLHELPVLSHQRLRGKLNQGLNLRRVQCNLLQARMSADRWGRMKDIRGSHEAGPTTGFAPAWFRLQGGRLSQSSHVGNQHEPHEHRVFPDQESNPDFPVRTGA